MKIFILIILILIPSISFSEPRLYSNNYLVMNLDTHEVLLNKNSNLHRSIASITKVMTAIVTIEANNLRGTIKITKEDIDTLKHTSSRIQIGSVLDKHLALKLMLQSSENRAANALMRSYPGGYIRGIEAMNRKAQQLGMKNTKFFDASGLNPNSKSTAEDVCILINYAMKIPLIRSYSTSKIQKYKGMTFINSNPLVRNNTFNIEIQKTGFINESNYCVALISNIGGNRIAMIFLNSPSPSTRFQDAHRVYMYLNQSSKNLPKSPARL